jgi:hypothetical protein
MPVLIVLQIGRNAQAAIQRHRLRATAPPVRNVFVL